MTKFNLRDILWLLLVVGLAAAWWRSHGEMSQELQTARDHAQKVGDDQTKNYYYIWDVARGWAKEVDRELTIQSPTEVLKVSPSGKVVQLEKSQNTASPDLELVLPGREATHTP